MAWLAQSIANSLRLEDNDDDDRANHFVENNVAPVNRKKEGDAEPIYHQQKQQKEEEGGGEGEEAHGRGVKEDFADLKESLARQLWGAASFLAPPPGASVSYLDQSSGDEGEPTESEKITGGFSEIGGKFRTGISMMASNYRSLGSEEDRDVEVGEEDEGEELEEQDDEECGEWDGDEAVGVTDETLAFASNIALHPETWLDFPLDEEEDLDDFEMSDAQREHAFVIERLAPRLAALRTELCHCHMAESYFWKVYFVLLHSRLNKHDAEILSTAQVMEARAMWMQELQKQSKPESDWCGKSLHLIDSSTISPEDFDSPRTSHFEQAPCTAEDYDIEKHVVVETETPFFGKVVSEEKPVVKTEEKDLPTDPSSKIAILNFEDDDDDWPDEEDSDLIGYKAITPMCNVEDISFSDLEDDASGT